MLKLIHTCLAFCFLGLLAAQGQEESPMQKLPVGVEESKYFLREPSGLTEISPRVEPPNWWVGMQHKTLELLIYAPKVAKATQAKIKAKGVSVAYLKRLENPNYLFLGLSIREDAQAEKFQVLLQDELDQTIFRFDYTLAARSWAAQEDSITEESLADTKALAPASEATANKATANKATASEKQGNEKTSTRKAGKKQNTGSSSKGANLPPLGAQDLIYLILPDRFANGDSQNDSVEGMQQQGVARHKFLFRHGGDLLGIMERLDYLEQLGVTAIWLNPVLENDQPYESYHGYAVTDHYRIDRRLGTNEQYKLLVQMAHERGIKVIMDVIFNHVGDQHYQILDIPSRDWIHQWPQYTQTTYRATTLLDPYATDYDRRLMTDGWFDKHMPDLNQQNPHLANYLIQNSIWWTAYSGQDAFRIDTYAYPDPHFMAEWNRRLQAEFPQLGIFGETWVHGPAVQAWFTQGDRLHPPFNTALPGVTDFQLYYAINEALAKDPGWTDGVLRLYYTLAQDYLYEQPEKNVVFLDNHDLARFFTVVGQDMDKFKSGLALLLSLRGIPMLYYGTELGFTGEGGGFGEGGRVDFPGGWHSDQPNLFQEKDRNATQQTIFNYVKRLANFRKNNAVMWQGTFRQYVPQDGLYCFYRQLGEERMIVFFNGKNSAQSIDLQPYQAAIGPKTEAYDLTRDEKTRLDQSLTLKAKETRILIIQ